MAKINKHIEIVRSNISGLSSMSKASCSAIYDLLRQHYARVNVTIVDNLSDLRTLCHAKPDLVFLGMKFIPFDHRLGRQDKSKIWLSAYLDEQGIKYTGSAQEAIEFESNKPLAKQQIINAGLDSSQFFIVKQDEEHNEADFPFRFPMFVKPTSMGSGQGVDSDSVVDNLFDLKTKVISIGTNYQSDSLVEEYLPGREFSVAILARENSDKLTVMPIELVAERNSRGHRILGRSMKSSNQEQVSEVAESMLRDSVVKLATDAYRALGVRDYGRIDIRLDKEGTPQFLEANLIPSLITGYGSFAKACVINDNIGYDEMILRIVNLGMARSNT